MKLGNTVKICKCPSCLNVYSIDEWDSNTLSTCNRRSVRRHFKSLENAIIKNKDFQRIYVCPGCRDFVYAKDIVKASNKKD